jgi:hypothetical protein
VAIVADGIDAIIGADSTYDVVGFSFGGTMASCVGAIRGKRSRSVNTGPQPGSLEWLLALQQGARRRLEEYV